MKKLQFDEKDVWNSKAQQFTAINMFNNKMFEEGYFSDRPDFCNYSKGNLTSLRIYENGISYTRDDLFSFDYFIPANKVKEVEVEETKYRPYETINDLPFKIGDVLKFRSKTEPIQVQWWLITGFDTDADNDEKLLMLKLGNRSFTPKQLFNNYDYFNGVEWKLFGVKNESN